MTQTIQDPARNETDLIEEGAALSKLHPGKGRRPTTGSGHRHDVIVIGGGQAGLSVGYHLARAGLKFSILDGSERIGDPWRARWDSLRLFTPAKFNSLDGMPFPAHRDHFPTKDEMADYLESYAKHFDLPVRSGTWVERLERRGDHYIVTANGERFEADQVIVAMARYQKPKLPEFSRELRSDIRQLHSSAYKNPGQLRKGSVLLVGAGNSGSELAMELSKTHHVFMSGPDVGHLPFRVEGLLGRLFLMRLVLRVLFHRVLTIRTPMGKKARPKVLHGGGPLVRVKPIDLDRAGVERVPRVACIRDGFPLLEDGRMLKPDNVVWCSGYRSALSFIDLPVPIVDALGEPRHEGGVVPDAPGLYFVGLHFQYALSSGMIHGVGRDAERIVRVAAARARQGAPEGDARAALAAA